MRPATTARSPAAGESRPDEGWPAGRAQQLAHNAISCRRALYTACKFPVNKNRSEGVSHNRCVKIEDSNRLFLSCANQRIYLPAMFPREHHQAGVDRTVLGLHIRKPLYDKGIRRW